MSEDQNGGFFRSGDQFFMSIEGVENRAPLFFGHFSIAMAACIMYSPFIFQTAMGFTYIVVIGLVVVLDAKKFSKSLIVAIVGTDGLI